MSTPANPVQVNKLSLILTILNAGLAGLAVAVPGAAAAEYFLQIVVAGIQAYHAETGQPIDLNRIPLEPLVP